MWFIKLLKFPLWLLKLFIKKPNKKISQREKNQRAYVRNFSIRHYSWQKSIGKNKQKKRKNNKNFRKRAVKKVNDRVATKKVPKNPC